MLIAILKKNYICKYKYPKNEQVINSSYRNIKVQLIYYYKFARKMKFLYCLLVGKICLISILFFNIKIIFFRLIVFCALVVFSTPSLGDKENEEGRKKCSRACSRELMPVCAEEELPFGEYHRKTFGNRCLVRVENCVNNRSKFS